MSRNSRCPDSSQLRRVLDCGLPDESHEEVVEHLNGCACCQQSLEQIAAGEEVMAVGACLRERGLPAATSAYWPALQSLREEVTFQADTPMPHSAIVIQADTPPVVEAIVSKTVTPSGTENISLDFLAPSDNPEYRGKLGHFEIVGPIGRGGMGVVLRAMDACLQRSVAIKVLDPQLANDETARKRFCREARAAAAVTHENVVAVYQVEREETKDMPFLVMQLVTGTSLEDRLQSGAKLELKDILRIGMQTSAGLAAAHEQGLVHRDVKPANILLEAGTDRVKLTDFGLARAIEDVKLTQTGFVAGTPLYMAPEQARGEPVDHRADLFSLGSVLYELCTGRPPFEGNTPFVVLRRVTEEIPKPIRDFNPNVPYWLVDVIEKLLAKNPKDRYQTAQEVAEVLGQYHGMLVHSGAVPLSNKPPCALERRSKTVQVLVPIFVVALIAGLGAGAVLLYQSDIWGTTPVRATLDGKAGPVWSAAFDRDGTNLAMAIDDGTIRLWDPVGGQPRSTFQAHRGPIWSAAFSPDGKMLATASDDGTARLWEPMHGREINSFKHGTGVRAVAFGPDSKALATGSRDGSVRIWNLSTGRETLTSPGHASVVMGIAFSPDGTLVATASGDKTVKLWDAQSGQERLTLRGHEGGVYGVAFSPNGLTLVSCGWDKTVRIWSVASGENQATLPGHTKDVWSVAYSPDGQLLASASEDQTVKLWSVASGKEVKTYKGHEGTLYTVSFSRDGKTLASGGRDGTVKLWDVPGK